MSVSSIELAPAARSHALDDVIPGRRSVRSFVPGPVPRDMIERAIAAAGWAPSPHGRQPWRFVVLESVERRTALAEAMAADWREQLVLDGQSSDVVEIRLAKSRERMLSASLLIIPCLYLDELDVYPDPERQEAERLMAIQSIGAAIQNLLLSLYADGLDAGWMCAPLFCPDIVRRALGLDAGLIPHAMLPVGYAAKEPVRRPRRSIDELIVGWR
jgi:coenzyme F420-0:L-glutamate ligase / coenzyme F420-1:gamma-L-glutamate ligase